MLEVLSPSTRRFDLLLVDPNTPAITVLELRDGVYEQVAHVTTSQSRGIDLSFPLTLTPASLVT